jgi:hypothetical protein
MDGRCSMLILLSDLAGDREIVLAAITPKKDALKNVPVDVKTNRELMLEAVTQNSYALRHASPALRGDREVVLAAVAQNGHALNYASAALQIDREALSESRLGKQERGAYQLAQQQHGFRPPAWR